MRYLLDSDALITAHNLHYQPSFCGGFWEWIEAGHAAKRLFSIDKVRRELTSGRDDDRLSAWAKDGAWDSFFLSTAGTLGKWRDLAKWADERVPSFREHAKQRFLRAEAADAWLIAFAAHHGNYTIITNEVGNKDSVRDIKLPDAAAHVGVRTLPLYLALSELADANFAFRH